MAPLAWKVRVMSRPRMQRSGGWFLAVLDLLTLKQALEGLIESREFRVGYACLSTTVRVARGSRWVTRLAWIQWLSAGSRAMTMSMSPQRYSQSYPAPHSPLPIAPYSVTSPPDIYKTTKPRLSKSVSFVQSSHIGDRSLQAHVCLPNQVATFHINHTP